MRLFKRTFAIILTLVLISANAFAFSDIDNHWSKDHIKRLSDKDILTGYSDGSFRPDKTISREEAAVVVAKMLGDKKIEAKDVFKDVENDRWSAKYIAYLNENGVIKGYGNNTFRPTDKITRAEFSRILYAVLDSKGELYELKKDFSDIKDSWASEYIKYLAGNKIINGFSGTLFKPEDSITRGEAAAMTDRVMVFRTDPLKFIQGEEVKVPPNKIIDFDPNVTPSVIGNK